MLSFKLLAVLLLLFTLSNSRAIDYTTTDSELNKTVTTLFDGMRGADGNLLRSVLTEEATLQTVISRDGAITLSGQNISRFIESVENATKGDLDEQLTSLLFHQDGELATAWMEYRFYYRGEFSHCGVNSMNLIHTESGWKIFSIVDTRRREGC